MKHLFKICLAALILVSCNSKDSNNKFSLNGTIKNVPDQKIYLEQLYFSNKNPEVLDTAEIKGGKFQVKALAPEEGLFRLRLEKDKAVFIFINDKKDLVLNADFKNLSIKTIDVHSPANDLLKQFIVTADGQQEWLYNKAQEIKAFEKTPETDSVYNVMRKEHEAKSIAYEKFLVNFIDTCKDPVVTMFALYTGNVEQSKLDKPIGGLTKRFPGNAAVAAVVNQYNQSKEQATQREQVQADVPKVGDIAPEITMPDTDEICFLSVVSEANMYWLIFGPAGAVHVVEKIRMW